MVDPDTQLLRFLPSKANLALYLGAGLFHLWLLMVIHRTDQNFVAYSHAVSNGEPKDSTFEWLDNSWIAVWILLVFLGPLTLVRHGTKIIWALPITWFAVYLLVFLPHS